MATISGMKFPVAKMAADIAARHAALTERSTSSRLNSLVSEAVKPYMTSLSAGSVLHDALNSPTAQALRSWSATQTALTGGPSGAIRDWAMQRQQMHEALSLLHDRFPASVLDPAGRFLDEVDESQAQQLEIDEAELPSETVEEIERTLSEVIPQVSAMPPEVARAFIVYWVRAVVFSLWLTGVLTVPAFGTATGLIGLGGLQVAWTAGTRAGRTWDRLMVPRSPDEPD